MATACSSGLMMDLTERDLVLVVGDSPLSPTPFTERKLKLVRVTAEEAPAKFNEARAVVISDAPQKFGLIKRMYGSLFPPAQDYGLLPLVIVHSQPDFVLACAIRQKDFPTLVFDNQNIFLIDDLANAAELIVRHEVGPPAGNVTIEPDDANLSCDDKLLLRRAFSDCERVFLEPLFGGKASLGVFRVHAWLKASQVGPCPLPFFVKIADPDSVDKEQRNYRDYAQHYIPFNLRPNVDQARCVRTRARAALVGNFVDDAVPLRASLRSGHGVGALFALFETTLRGFRLQPLVTRQQPIKGLEVFAKYQTWAEKVPDETVATARSFGFACEPVTVESRICGAARNIDYISGPIHGDLHPGNIMVRGRDVILIDFSLAKSGPLTADLAALEVSLMFGTDERDDPSLFDDWRALIEEVYSDVSSMLHPAVLSERRPGPYSWLRRSLHELRHVLLESRDGGKEAIIMLAAHLLRFARLPAEDLPTDPLKALAHKRHCYALVVAERIANAIDPPEKKAVH